MGIIFHLITRARKNIDTTIQSTQTNWKRGCSMLHLKVIVFKFHEIKKSSDEKFCYGSFVIPPQLQHSCNVSRLIRQRIWVSWVQFLWDLTWESRASSSRLWLNLPWSEKSLFLFRQKEIESFGSIRMRFEKCEKPEIFVTLELWKFCEMSRKEKTFS